MRNLVAFFRHANILELFILIVNSCSLYILLANCRSHSLLLLSSLCYILGRCATQLVYIDHQNKKNHFLTSSVYVAYLTESLEWWRRFISNNILNLDINFCLQKCFKPLWQVFFSLATLLKIYVQKRLLSIFKEKLGIVQAHTSGFSDTMELLYLPFLVFELL